VETRCADYTTHLHPQDLALNSPTSDGDRSVYFAWGLKAKELFCSLCPFYSSFVDAGSTASCNVYFICWTSLWREKFFRKGCNRRWNVVFQVRPRNKNLPRMASSGRWRRVDLVKTDVSSECNTSIMRVTRIGELGATLQVTINRRTLRRNTVSCHPDDGGATILRNVVS
jgi:hypothetical protein